MRERGRERACGLFLVCGLFRFKKVGEGGWVLGLGMGRGKGYKGRSSLDFSDAGSLNWEIGLLSFRGNNGATAGSPYPRCCRYFRLQLKM